MLRRATDPKTVARDAQARDPAAERAAEP